MTAFATILTHARNGVLTITLNRPDARNAVNEQMGVELGAALHLAQREDAVRCVVLTGAGSAFCAGQDLKELKARQQGPTGGGGADFGLLLRQRYNPLVLRMRALEKPIVGAINGVAAGGGAGLALAADLRIAAESAAFVMPFVGLGLVPDCALTLTLVQQIGYARAAHLCLTGEPLAADEALHCGLLSKVVLNEELPEAAQNLGERLAAWPPTALGLTKRALQHAWTATLEEQLEYEAFVQATAGQTAEHREGLAAFLEKRPPNFRSPRP